MENVSMFWMYIIAMLPDIKDALVLSFPLFFMFIAMLVSVGIKCFTVIIKNLEHCDEEDLKIAQIMHKLNPMKTIIGVWAVLYLLSWSSNFIPDHKQLAFIVGGHWAINNEDLREMPDNVAKVVNGYLEELGEEVNKEGE